MYVESGFHQLRHRILLQLDKFLTLFDAFRRPYLTGRATIGRLELPPGEGRFHGRFVDPPLRATPPPRITAYTPAGSFYVWTPYLSPGLDNSTGNSTVTRQDSSTKLDSYSTDLDSYSTDLDSYPPDSDVCLRRQGVNARQLDSSTELDRARQTSTEPSRYGPAR